ncbi:acylphosphatase [Mucilaginibacter xinganensis]|uniref:acylphosphatase n=1 Tax=Mucilaginibacter xinganensis TaxID=1234841 RepID=A0A223P2J5_9SPHI|nr:acylphosphatase [Mucilaginibacter xinganensis]ASU36041.1 acylphosphatase [Mucilaginibacter xinganensis]
MKHLDIIIKGTVQGVSLRAAAKAVADQLSVKGFVKNELNGDVTIEAEGDSLSLEMFLEWCNEGSEHATITSIETNEGELKNYRNFEIVKKSR